MSPDLVRHPAEERLLDAALAQVLGEADAAPVRTRSGWFAAAMLLLGLAVAAVMLWHGRTRGLDTAQQPAPMPDAAWAEGRTAIEALPADTQNVECTLLRPEDISALRRLRSLRRVGLRAADMKIGRINLRTRHTDWLAPPAAALAPLADLPALEVVSLPYDVALAPEHLRALQPCARLRELRFIGEKTVLTEPMVEALRGMPNLRCLQLDIVRLDAAAMERLRSLPLEELGISRCPGFDEKAWGALCDMATLRRLAFQDLGRAAYGANKAGDPLWKPTPDDLRRLGDLPRLERLAFEGCALTDDDMSALPDTITGLAVRAHELGPDGFRQLRRFGALRSLELSTARYSLLVFRPDPEHVRAATADATAEALGSLRLTTLEFSGALTDSLLRQIGAQPDLTEVRLRTRRVPPLDALAGARALQRLEIRELQCPPHCGVDELRPLRDCRALRRLELFSSQPFDVAEIRQALGGSIEVAVKR